MRYQALLFFVIFMAFPAGAQDILVPQSREQISLSFAPVVKKISPSVVNIYTKRVIQKRVRHPFLSDPFFAPFFGNRVRKRVENALGSGAIIDPDGLIVTNAHVVEDADEIMVVLQDGREFSASLQLADKPSDVAVLKLDEPPNNLPIIDFKSSDEVEVGDLVLAIGNPFGVGQSVTSGIVSAMARTSADINDFNFFIQTDAAVNPGNSGGPLVTTDGKVIGINTAIFSRSGGSLGIGFAIPSEMVKSVISAAKSTDAMQNGRITRGWLGFTMQKLDGDMAKSIGLDAPRGALIKDIHPASPAAKAGLQIGDVIIALHKRDITTPEELKFRLATIPVNGSVRMIVLRNDEPFEIAFILEQAPEIPARDAQNISGKNPLNGAQLVNASPAVIEVLSLPYDSDGVFVERIKPRSAAARMGLRIGDKITSINGEEIHNTKNLRKILGKRTHQWAIEITSRNGSKRQVIIR